jgi:poly-gamma-glutamate capsule biosynthesis protein CapA/YwtB (metallophosphatase superfamily)
MTNPDFVTLFLCGDVMTGRGIDQILPHPAGHHLYEPYVQDARQYVKLAEALNGPIGKPVAPSYIWGDALGELERVTPDARIINLETSVTARDEYWPGKGINYRMHPENVGCLTAARIDVCALANNHVLDYGYNGLAETLDTLRRAGLKTVGAGQNLDEARAPAVIPLANGGRVIVCAFGAEDSGIPERWAARAGMAGVDLLPDLSEKTAMAIADRMRREKGPRDVTVASVHWGSNWGYAVPRDEVQFAHWLVDGGIDIVHGHSSHHPRPIEVYRHRLILYGCGDFIDDYEGIEGYEQYRDDLVLMYFATLSQQGSGLAGLKMTPMQIKKMRLNRATPADSAWLRDTLERVSAPYGSHVDLQSNGTLTLRWEKSC